MATHSAHDYTLNAGHPLLDFVNTVSAWTGDDRREYLTDFAEVIRFSVLAGLLDTKEAAALRKYGDGAAELLALRRLRRLLYEVLSAFAHDQPPATASLDALAEQFRAAGRSRRWTAGAGGGLQRDQPIVAMRSLRDRIALSAEQLLESPQAARLGCCPGCAWLFLDTSRNGSRRWCSMAACGNVDKARNYYHRARAASTRSKSRRARNADEGRSNE